MFEGLILAVEHLHPGMRHGPGGGHAVDLVRDRTGRSRAAADKRGPCPGHRARDALRAAGAEFQHGPPFRGAADAAGFCGNQALMVEFQQHIGFQKLGLDGRRAHGDHRLARENRGSFRNCPDVPVKTEILQGLQEFLVKHPASAQIRDIVLGKMQVLDIVNNLLQTGGNRITAFIRHAAEENVKIRDPILISRFPVTVPHGQFVKIAEHGQVDAVCRSHWSFLSSCKVF